MGYIPKAERRRRRAAAARGVGKDENGNGKKDKSVFWAGMIMGAATATGGYFAIRALEKAFGKKGEPAMGSNGLALNPGAPDDARARLVAAATGNPPAIAPPKPAVTKRTIIEEMVEDLE